MNKKLLLTLTALPLLLGSCGESKATVKNTKLETNQTLTIYDHGQQIGSYYWYSYYQCWYCNGSADGSFQTLTYSINLYTTVHSITVKLSDSALTTYNGQTPSDQTFTYVGLDLSYRVFTK